MKSWQARTLAGVAAALAIVLAIVLFQDRDDDRMVEVNTGPGVQLDARPQAEIQVDDSSGSIPDRMLKDIAEVALGATGGGVVTGVERSDDPGEAFEVTGPTSCVTSGTDPERSSAASPARSAVQEQTAGSRSASKPPSSGPSTAPGSVR